MPITRNSARRGGSSGVTAPAFVPSPTGRIPAKIASPVEETKEFGRDKDIKNLLKNLQPETFTGEGSDVPKDLEHWIMSMEDYFSLAQYNNIAKGIMGRAKVGGSAKLWRKLSCESRGMVENTQGWEDLKLRLEERYLPLNYSTNKMNDFLACKRKSLTVEEYHEDFIKLSRYAPLMTEEQKLSRFILGLEGKLASEVESLRPVSLADALIRAQSKLNSIQPEDTTEGSKRNLPHLVPDRNPKTPFVPTPAFARPPIPCPPRVVQARALPMNSSGKNFQCFGCKEWGHKKIDCPKERNPTRFSLPSQRNFFQNRNLGHQAPRNPPTNTAGADLKNKGKEVAP